MCGTSYDGVSLNDAIKSGRQAATGVAARLWGESRTAAAVVPMLAGGTRMSTTRHVVLVTYGEPPTPSWIDQLVYSWRILLGLTRTVAAIPAPVVPLIALSRARFRHRLWTAHGYGSPLEAHTLRQAARLRDTLAAAEGGDWRVHVAYEFRRPLLDEVLRGLPGGEPAWVAPMYAADSAFTHALSRETVRQFTSAAPRPAPIAVLPALDGARLADAVRRPTSGSHAPTTAGKGPTSRWCWPRTARCWRPRSRSTPAWRPPRPCSRPSPRA